MPGVPPLVYDRRYEVYDLVYYLVLPKRICWEVGWCKKVSGMSDSTRNLKIKSLHNAITKFLTFGECASKREGFPNIRNLKIHEADP
jgi:hypothetical protein